MHWNYRSCTTPVRWSQDHIILTHIMGITTLGKMSSYWTRAMVAPGLPPQLASRGLCIPNWKIRWCWYWNRALCPYLLQFAVVLFDGGYIWDGTEVFTDGQVWALMLVQLNHQLIELQLQFLKQQETLFSHHPWHWQCTWDVYTNIPMA